MVTLWTKIKREGWGLLCPHAQGAARETHHPQVSCVMWTPRTSCRCGSGWLWGAGKTFCGAPGTSRRQSWGFAGKNQPGVTLTPCTCSQPLDRSDSFSFCPLVPRDPESSPASPGVVLSHLSIAESLTSRPKKRENCPELSCAQGFAASMAF